jgi:hypothetical protein
MAVYEHQTRLLHKIEDMVSVSGILTICIASTPFWQFHYNQELHK